MPLDLRTKFQFSIGQTVYFKLGEHRGMVTGIALRYDGLYFLVTWEHDLVEKWHTQIELTDEPNWADGRVPSSVETK